MWYCSSFRRKSSTFEATSNKVIPTSTTINNENSNVQLQPSTSIKPAQTIKTANEQESKAPVNASIRPKTVARPPIFPSRPIGNGVKPSSPIQQPSTPIPESTSNPQFAQQLFYTCSSPWSYSSCFTKIFHSLSYPQSTRFQWTNYSKSSINSNFTNTQICHTFTD